MMNLSYIKLLKNRNFVIYLISQMISVFSDAVFKISLMWYLVSYENSLSSIAEVLFVSYLPNILVALFGGYFVDVCNRKKIMIGCDFFSACALVVFYFVISTQTLNMIFILLIRFFLSLMDVFYAPASSCFLLKMVSDDELVSAKLLFNTVYSSLNIISAGLGSIMLAMIGLKNVSLFNALAYLLASICILLINVDGKVEHNKIEAFSFFECIRGFYEIIHNHFLVQFTSVILFTNIVYDIVYPIIAVYVKDVLNADVSGLGMIQSTVSMGMIFGAIITGMFKINKPSRLFIFGTLVQGIILIMIGMNTNIYWTVFFFFIFSWIDAFATPLFAYFQTYVKDEIRGRVFSAFDSIVLLSSIISSFIIKVIGNIQQIYLIYVGSGLFCIFCFFLFSKFKSFHNIEQ